MQEQQVTGRSNALSNMHTPEGLLRPGADGGGAAQAGGHQQGQQAGVVRHQALLAVAQHGVAK